MIAIMKDLKTQWGFLKDDSKAKIDRRQACKRIIQLSELAKSNDPKFETIDMNNTVYAEFVPKLYKADSNVNWGEEIVPTKAEQLALDKLERLEGIAVQSIRKKLPNEADDSQKFGMIVSAFTEKLVKVYIFQNS